MSKTLGFSIATVLFILGIGLGYVISPEYAKQSEMHSNTFGNADSRYDYRFIKAMIEHHEGAIAMAEDAKLKSTREEVLNLANNIIDVQAKEIEQMEQWLIDWYK